MKIPLKDGSKDTIITWLYNINLIHKCIKKLKRKLWNLNEDDIEDKIQDIYLMLAEKPQEEWDELYIQGKYCIMAYVAGLVKHQFISDTSDCYRKYDRHNSIEQTKSEEFWKDYEEKQSI